jgi:four helix bundle protein
MTNKKDTIKSFTDLNVWQKAHNLATMVYEHTEDFPQAEMFGLVSQMRRCAVSITANIAEGFSRRSYEEKKRFYNMAQGSVTELQSQLLIARDVGHLNEERFDTLSEQAVTTHKLVNGLISSTRARAENPDD